MKTIVVIGAGNIGGSLIAGILKSGIADREHVIACETAAERAEQIRQQYGIRVIERDARTVVPEADAIIVAVKPQTVPHVLKEIREVLRADQVLISVAAAVPIRLIEKVVGRQVPVFRAMPNIPVMVDEGATGLAWNNHASPEQRAFVESIFRSVGVVCAVNEELMDAVTGLSGSGPAYIYMVIEALIAGGLKVGLPHDIATRLAEQTVLGAAKLVRETMLHPAILKDRVITPGGVTIAAIHELERHGLRAMLISAVETATRRSQQLTQSLMEKFDCPEQ